MGNKIQTIFSGNEVNIRVKIQFALLLLILIFLPLFSYWIYTLVSSLFSDNAIIICEFEVSHVWFVLMFQLLVAYMITTSYKHKMKLSYGKHLQIHYLASLAPLVSFALNYNDDSTYDIISTYIRWNFNFMLLVIYTSMNFYSVTKIKYDSNK